MKLSILLSIAAIFCAQTSLSSQYTVPFELEVDAYVVEQCWQEPDKLSLVSYKLVGRLLSGHKPWNTVQEKLQSLGATFSNPATAKIAPDDSAKSGSVIGKISIFTGEQSAQMREVIEDLQTDKILCDVRLV